MADGSSPAEVLPASTETTGFSALRSGAAFLPLGAEGLTASGGWIAVTGSDRVRWLNGMVTNSVQALPPGEGAYSFLLSAQGRIQGDLTVWAEADRLLLQTSRAQVESVTSLLDRFIIMDDVELENLTDRSFGLLVAGPAAAECLARIGIAARPSRLLKRQPVPWRERPLVLVNAYSPAVPRFELWSDREEDISGLQRSLRDQTAAVAASPADAELLRIFEGTPLYGRDIRDRDLPQETAQTRALHFNKGCYLGQEIVERIRSRGNVHRTFTRFVLDGDVPAPGTTLEGEGKPVGELTSVAASGIDGERLALGFVRREALERGLPLLYAGGRAAPKPAVAAS